MQNYSKAKNNLVVKINLRQLKYSVSFVKFEII